MTVLMWPAERGTSGVKTEELLVSSSFCTCLGCNHQSRVAFIVLLIDVYEGASVKPMYDVHKAFAARRHQAILLVAV